MVFPDCLLSDRHYQLWMPEGSTVAPQVTLCLSCLLRTFPENSVGITGQTSLGITQSANEYLRHFSQIFISPEVWRMSLTLLCESNIVCIPWKEKHKCVWVLIQSLTWVLVRDTPEWTCERPCETWLGVSCLQVKERGLERNSTGSFWLDSSSRPVRK